ncbi:protein YgfX [Vibrio zhanjiangensis]|uniref:protein YgfX n=1 Tax=Vibrio zhanjiangensis TaxID=1046128 RepID=UPI0024E1236F|nr:protein YgfX [Vibrio zhanjiangensis]
MLILASCWFSVSEMPLPITVYLVGYLSVFHLRTNWLANAFRGQLVMSNSGVCFVNGKETRIQKITTSLSAFGLLMQFSDGEKYILWRDSVSDEHYRQLLLSLKRERYAP